MEQVGPSRAAGPPCLYIGMARLKGLGPCLRGELGTVARRGTARLQRVVLHSVASSGQSQAARLAMYTALPGHHGARG